MSIVNILDKVTEWVQEEICNPVKFKLPPDGDFRANAEEYEYKEIIPASFPLYVPTEEKLPPGILTSIPSAVTRLLKGTDDQIKKEGQITLDICFCAWNPGTHGKDVLNLQKTGEYKESQEKDSFQVDANGWRDVWNWVDLALRKLEETTNINGIAIDRTVPIMFGPLQEQEAIPDFYPLWFAWVSFAVKYPILRNETIEKFL